MKSHMLALVRRDSCFTGTSDCAEDLFMTSTLGQKWINLTANANVGPHACISNPPWCSAMRKLRIFNPNPSPGLHGATENGP
jgi:hypothetical protein